MFERRLLKNADWVLVATVIALVLYGLAMIYAASLSNRSLTGDDPLHFVKRQALWLAAAMAAAAVCACLDYQQLARWHRTIYVAVIGGLLVVTAVGLAARGAARWIGVGGMRFQPSEFAKVALIVTLAALLARRHQTVTRPSTAAAALLHIGPPAALIALQPDLGSALIVVLVWFVMLFLAGGRKLHLGVAALGLAVLFAGAWKLDLLRPYQRARLSAFINPGVDPLGSGYHVIQSTIAVGSGRLLGRGYLAGTQSQLHFIPEQHTDFIFTVVGEELGFVGAVCLLGLYLVVLWRGLAAMDRADDAFGMLLAGGIVAAMALQVLINIGMTVHMMPITGLPLPFFSYGGSSLVASMMAVGLLLSIGMRRQRIRF